MPEIEERVDSLERLIKEFVTNVGIEFNKLYNSQMRTEAELREFKDEMKTFKDEMSGFKDEISNFKDEMRSQTRDMNIKWGEMAKKLGTIVEDLVAPSISKVVKETLGLELEFFGIRIKKKLKDGKTKEYDAIASAGDYVFLNSTKSTIESLDVKDFIKEIKEFRDFFPEYKEKKIIGIMASLSVDESLVKYREKSGFFVLATGSHLMEIKNTKGFKPKEW